MKATSYKNSLHDLELDIKGAKTKAFTLWRSAGGDNKQKLEKVLDAIILAETLHNEVCRDFWNEIAELTNQKQESFCLKQFGQ